MTYEEQEIEQEHRKLVKEIMVKEKVDDFAATCKAWATLMRLAHEDNR